MATYRRLASWTGLAGALLGVSTTLLATLASPSFSWTGSALSDLGAPGAPTAWLFDGGLVVAGLVALPFAWPLLASARHVAERLGAVAYAGAVVALALVGAFPTGTALHVPLAVGYFGLLTSALWIHGTGAVLAGDPGRGLAAVWLGIGHVLAWAGWLAAGPDGVAIPELFGSAVLVAWLAWTTAWLRRPDGWVRAADGPGRDGVGR